MQRTILKGTEKSDAKISCISGRSAQVTAERFKIMKWMDKCSELKNSLGTGDSRGKREKAQR